MSHELAKFLNLPVVLWHTALEGKVSVCFETHIILQKLSELVVGRTEGCDFIEVLPTFILGGTIVRMDYIIQNRLQSFIYSFLIIVCYNMSEASMVSNMVILLSF